jgi:galactonate dehydratase
VTGEILSEDAEFAVLLNHHAANILNPDITCVGLSAVTSIAASAQTTSCKVAVHNFNSMGPALAAGLHAGAAIQNLAGVEYFSRFKAATDTFCQLHWQQVEEGWFALTEASGLGISVDESALTGFDYKPATKRPWPS